MFTRLVGCGIKSMWLEFKTEVLISGVEKVSDHGTIGPRKYFGSQKEKDHT